MLIFSGPMQNAFGDIKLASIEACENWLADFFANSDKGFFELAS